MVVSGDVKAENEYESVGACNGWGYTLGAVFRLMFSGSKVCIDRSYIVRICVFRFFVSIFYCAPGKLL